MRILMRSFDCSWDGCVDEDGKTNGFCWLFKDGDFM
jgi:hypothetical protein